MAKRILCLALSIVMVVGIVAIALTARAGDENKTHYVIDAARDGDTYIVTVKCNWTDFEMLNGEFRFTYPTDELELLLEDRAHGPIDPANNLTPLPGAEVGVDTTTGEIRLAFISADGSEFADGWVTMLVLPFRLLHPEVEDLNVKMETETLVAAGSTPDEKVDVLEETEVPDEVVFEKPVDEVPTTVITTTTTTTTKADESTTTAPVIDPAVGAEHYTVKVFVADGQATVTVQCDYTAWYVLNGQFEFSYPTDVLDLAVTNKTMSKLSALPSKAVRVEEELGKIHIAFMSTDGAEFLDGPVDVLKAQFDILDSDAKDFELVMKCNTLKAWEEGNATGKDMLADGIMPTALRWKVSLEPTPTTTTTTTTTTTAPTEPPKKLGDVNGDNTVDSTDARIALQRAVNKIGDSGLDMTVADVNGDNTVDSTDARVILQFAVNKISKFPIE